MTNPTTQYAQDVVDGTVIAGPYVRAACRRHLEDLKRNDLYFDVGKAQHFFDFCSEVLCLNGGEFEGIPFDPNPWQLFVFGNLFGWYNKIDGTRRFRKAFIECGKGAGKGLMASAVALYGLVADNEPRAEVYLSAAKRDQAMITMRDVVSMVDQSPELHSRLKQSGLGQNVWNIAHLQSGSFLRPLASDKAQSGTRPHFGILDEIHEHKDSNTVDMLLAGVKGRRQPLIFMITNSGHDKNTVCWNYHEYGRKCSEQTIQDDTFFSYICAIDKEDDPFQDEECWIKANPNLGYSIKLSYLKEQVAMGRGMPAKESIVRRLNFCEWVGSSNPWISGEVWMSSGQRNFNIEPNRRCWGGLDLGSTQDLTSLVLVFEPTKEDKYWRMIPFFWLPDDDLLNKGTKDGVDYIQWVREGYLETTQGKAISKLAIVQRLLEISNKYNIVSINFDRWRIEDLKQIMADEGVYIEMTNFGQGYQSMSPAVDKFETLLLNGEIKHNLNPCLTWNASNVILTSDAAGNRKPDKQKATGRIDGIVAAIMAVSAATSNYEIEPDIDQFLDNIITL